MVQLVLRIAFSPMRASTLTTTPAATNVPPPISTPSAMTAEGCTTTAGRMPVARYSANSSARVAVVADGDDERVGVDALGRRV